MNKLYSVVVALTAISAACHSAAQENLDYPVISMDKEARKALDWAIEQLEKKRIGEIEKILIGGKNE